MYKIFWNVSAQQRVDTAKFGLVFRQSKGGLSTNGHVPPETSSTILFAARLAYGFKRRGRPFRAELHTGPQEKLSGADLEIALQLPSGKWIDVALQAKRVYPGTPSCYQQWDRAQLSKLRSWAVRHGKDACGALLYNDTSLPFKPPRSRNPVYMGACCQQRVKCKGGLYPTTGPPSNESPLAITWAPLWPLTFARLALNNSPEVAHVNLGAQPIECLYCPNNAITSSLGSDAPPGWAQQMMPDELRTVEGQTAMRDEAENDRPLVSIVIPSVPGDEGGGPGDTLPWYPNTPTGKPSEPDLIRVDVDGVEVEAYWLYGGRLRRAERDTVGKAISKGIPLDWALNMAEKAAHETTGSEDQRTVTGGPRVTDCDQPVGGSFHLDARRRGDRV